MNTNILTVASMVVLLSIGLGVGWGFQTTVGSTAVSTAHTVTVTQTSNSSQSQGPYVLTLVLTTGSIYNSSVGDQPAFFVLTAGGLRSSANIALPTGRLIKLVIVNYDDGNASLTNPQYANVQGTVNGTVTYITNDNVNSSQAASGIVVKGGQTVSSVPLSEISHTFTIPTLGINIPIPVSSTVTAYFTIDKAGTYNWFCATTCGSGASGLEGAMSTSGWMTGNIEASEAVSNSYSGASSSGVASGSGPYMLTFIEIMQNMWNSSGVMQPEFFVLGDQGLESSANISLPVNRLIQLTIISYDTPTPGSTDAQGVVNGTLGGSVYVINGSVASGTANVPMADAANWGQNVTSIPGKDLVGTFTIEQLGINVPFVSDSTVIAYFELHHTGSFTWLCLTPCGLGPDGLLGAMDTPGWMMGNLEVS